MIIAVEQFMRYIDLLPLNEHYLCKSLIFLSDINLLQLQYNTICTYMYMYIFFISTCTCTIIAME